MFCNDVVVCKLGAWVAEESTTATKMILGFVGVGKKGSTNLDLAVAATFMVLVTCAY